MIVITGIFVAIGFIEFVYSPRVDVTKDKNILLWYNISSNGERTFFKLY